MDFKSSVILAFKDAFSPGMKKAQASLAGMKDALDALKKNEAITRLASDIASMTGMTEPMRRALSDALDKPARVAAALDSAFKDIQVATGAAGTEMEGLKQELLAIGAKSVSGPEAVASAYANIAGGVDDASKRMAIMNASVALAEANQADLGMTTNAMITVMNAWGLAAGDACIAADVLTQASLSGAGSLDDFASSVGSLSSLSARAGIGLDELGASLAFATSKGMSAAQAQKGFKSVISTLISPGESLSKIYASLGIKSGQAMLQQYGLAESLVILKNAVGENAQAFDDMMGSSEAATAALSLTEDAYVSFAGTFAEGMGSVTEAARSVQLEGIEAKMKRLDSASKSVQAKIGQNVNGIKGFFADIKTSFLADVVGPLMDTPVGGVLTSLAATTATLAKGVIDIGSGVLNTASQITTLSVSISNMGGMAKVAKQSLGLMKSGLSFLGAPLRMVGGGLATLSASVKSVGFLRTFQSGLVGIGKGFLGMGKSILGALPMLGGWIASVWAAAAAHIAACWPIYAIIAAIAALAAGVYLIIKNWDKISAFFKKLWEGVKSVFVSVWNAIKNFFIGIWEGFKKVLSFYLNFYKKIWDTAKSIFISIWNGIVKFFTNIWDGIKSVIKSVADWISKAFDSVVGPIKSVLGWVSGAANKIGKFLGIVKEPYEPKIDDAAWNAQLEALQATAKGRKIVQQVVGGMSMESGSLRDGMFDILSKVSAQLPHSDAKEGPLSTLTASGRALVDTFASGIQSNAAVLEGAFGTALQGISAQLPHSDAKEGPLSALTASGRAVTDTFASGMDDGVLRESASAVFSAAQQGSNKGAPKSAATQTIHIQNLYLQAEDCQTIFDFVKMLIHTTGQPIRGTA